MKAGKRRCSMLGALLHQKLIVWKALWTSLVVLSSMHRSPSLERVWSSALDGSGCTAEVVVAKAHTRVGRPACCISFIVNQCYYHRRCRRGYLRHHHHHYRNRYLWTSSSSSSAVYPRTNRKEETVIARLHIGHSFVTHSFLLNGEEPPTCIRSLTIEHILLACSFFFLNEREPLDSSITACCFSIFHLRRFLTFWKQSIFWQKLNLRSLLAMCFTHLLSIFFKFYICQF